MSEYKLRIADREYAAEILEMTAETARVAVDGVEYEVDLVQLARRPRLEPERPEVAARPEPTAPAPLPAPRAAAAPHGAGTVRAPMPGLVMEVAVREGQPVQAGQRLVLMEAMKMENVIPAPHTGTVRRLFVAEGDTVGEGDPLVEIARPEMTTL
jgi:biotin carboxyl carrier protein